MRIEPITKTLNPFGPGKSGRFFGARNEATSAKAMNTAATTISATWWPVDNPSASTPGVYALASSRLSSLCRRPRVNHQMSARRTAIGTPTMST